MSWLTGIFSGTMGATAALTFREFIAALLRKGPEMAVKKIEELIEDNPRADLLYVLLTLDEEEAKKFWDDYDQKARDEGFEDTFIKTMAQALPRNKEGEIDFERAKDIYTQILKMKPERFWEIYEELKHDPIAQRVKHWLEHGKDFAEALLEAIAYSAGVVARWGEQINQRAEQEAQQMNQTRFGRLANWLIK